MPVRNPAKKRPRSPFLITVATTLGAASMLPACGSADCPTDMPAEGSDCRTVGDECSYQTGPGTDVSATCQDDATWHLKFDPIVNPPRPPCPPEASELTGICSVNGICAYPVERGCGPVEVVYECLAGSSWKLTSTEPPCTPCKVHSTDAECSADPNCRWLIPPGCDTAMNALPAAGCFPKNDCDPSAACPDGEQCTDVNVHPCPDGTCNTCAEPIKLCVAPAP